jgi:hypothetical protein
MLFLIQLCNVFLAVGLVSNVIAHPGHDGTTEMKQRKRYMDSLEHVGLSACTAKMKKTGLEAKITARRQQMAKTLRHRSLEHHEGLISHGLTKHLANGSEKTNFYEPATFPLS